MKESSILLKEEMCVLPHQFFAHVTRTLTHNQSHNRKVMQRALFYKTEPGMSQWLLGLKKNSSTIDAPLPGVTKNHIFFSTNETVFRLR